MTPGPPTCSTGAPLAATHWASTFDVAGRPMRTNHVRPLGGEPLVAQEGVGDGDRARYVATARDRIGEQWPAGGGDEPGHVGASGARRAGEHEAARAPQQIGQRAIDLADRRGGHRRRRAAARWQRSRSADERLAERQVEVHRARDRGGGRPGAERAPYRGGGRIGDAGVVEPADRPAEEVGLVDGLRGTDVPQLRRPVGGDDDHRDVGEAGLDDRRVEVGRRGPARAEEDGRHAVEPGAEGDEGRHPLVMDDVHRQLAPIEQGQGDGSAA